MINKIEITSDFKTISKGFVLELGDITVITGENNSGKTNLIKAINDKNANFVENKININPEIIYIPAEQIRPSDDTLKYSAKGTGLIENLSMLFSNLGISFELDGRDKITSIFDKLCLKVNENIRNFIGSSSYKINLDSSKKLDPKSIIQLLINTITGNEDGEDRKFEDLGQGTQRIIIASILKAYIDLLIENKIFHEKVILILFEEPEVYLHPKLKRALNETLENISQQKNHQVIITTHDPYFTFKNSKELNKTIVSLKRNGKKTISEMDIIEGIEDELLHIYLFSRVLQRNSGDVKSLDNSLKKLKVIKEKIYYWRNDSGQEKSATKSLPVYVRHIIHHPDNEYTRSGKNQKYNEAELRESIEILNSILVNKITL